MANVNKHRVQVTVRTEDGAGNFVESRMDEQEYLTANIWYDKDGSPWRTNNGEVWTWRDFHTNFV